MLSHAFGFFGFLAFLPAECGIFVLFELAFFAVFGRLRRFERSWLSNRRSFVKILCIRRLGCIGMSCGVLGV